MRERWFLAGALAITAILLTGSRCDNDDAKAPGPAAAQSAPKGDGGAGRVDGGVEKDPLDGAMGGGGSGAAVEDGDLPPEGAGDMSLDDAPGEPQPVPEEGPK